MSDVKPKPMFAACVEKIVRQRWWRRRSKGGCTSNKRFSVSRFRAVTGLGRERPSENLDHEKELISEKGSGGVLVVHGVLRLLLDDTYFNIRGGGWVV